MKISIINKYGFKKIKKKNKKINIYKIHLKGINKPLKK
jgi:hypothetical protein